MAWLSLLCLRPALAASPLLQGPLFVRSRAPIYDGRLAYQPGPLQPVARGQVALQLGLSHVNTWAQMPGYTFDGEFTRLQARARVGVGSHTELVVDAGLLGRAGGFLDGAIEGFHRAFKLTQSRRDAYPRNRLQVRREDVAHAPGGLDGRDAGVGRASLVVGARHSLWQNSGGRAVVAEGALQLPTGDARRQFVHGGFGVLGDVALQAPLARWLWLYAAFGATVLPRPGAAYGMALSKVQKFLFLGLGQRLGPRVQLHLQYLNQDGAIERDAYRPLDKTTHEFALGIRWLAAGAQPAWALELGIIENTVHDANTPDVGLSLAVSWLGCAPAR